MKALSPRGLRNLRSDSVLRQSWYTVLRGLISTQPSSPRKKQITHQPQGPRHCEPVFKCLLSQLETGHSLFICARAGSCRDEACRCSLQSFCCGSVFIVSHLYMYCINSIWTPHKANACSATFALEGFDIFESSSESSSSEYAPAVWLIVSPAVLGPAGSKAFGFRSNLSSRSCQARIPFSLPRTRPARDLSWPAIWCVA